MSNQPNSAPDRPAIASHTSGLAGSEALRLETYIDHTVLKPETTAAQIDQLCDEALEYRFAAVCVNPVWVARCVRRLASGKDCGPVVCTVAGFPLGTSLPEIKAAEARRAVEEGALEVDMVVNMGALIGGERGTVTADIAAVVAAAKRANERASVKVILETRALSNEQIILGCRCVAEGQADYVKTSTGFHGNGGATVEHVALLRKHASPLRVKAAGGIRDLKAALAMIAAGADRLGMSASVAVMKEFRMGSGQGTTS